jgi:transcriptional regulator with XRE-family HTH domain
MNIQRSTEELESALGDQLRSARLRSNISVADLAKHSGLSINAVRRLEMGDGATVTTLVRVIRALGRETWLDTFQPAITISPLQMLKSTKARQRSSSTRKKAGPSASALQAHAVPVHHTDRPAR